MTHLRCDGKYDMSLVTNLFLSPRLDEFLKLANRPVTHFYGSLTVYCRIQPELMLYDVERDL